jgi:signal transduction histidine kinase
MTNVIKHAPRAHTQVIVRVEPESVFVSVVDDGAGTKRLPLLRHGRGLVGMRERTDVIGGRLEVDPNERSGFSVRAWLPLRLPVTS